MAVIVAIVWWLWWQWSWPSCSHHCSGHHLGCNVHDAKHEVQTPWLDNGGGVQPIDWWILHEPEFVSCIVEACMVEGEHEEVCWASSC